MTMTAAAPPEAVMTEQPRFTEASSAPSVVAMGTRNSPAAWSPLIISGPTKPRGTCTAPIMFSMFFDASWGSNDTVPICGRLAPRALLHRSSSFVDIGPGPAAVLEPFSGHSVRENGPPLIRTVMPEWLRKMASPAC